MSALGTVAARLPPEVIRPAAAVIFAMAILVFTVGLLRVAPSGRAGALEFSAGLGLALEFLLAAGLIRLAAIDSFRALGLVAAILIVRKFASAGLRLGVRAVGGPLGRLRA